MGPETSKDDFATVPLLEPDGSNYVMWKLRLEITMASKGTLGHLDGTAVEPPKPDPADAVSVEVHQKWQEKEYLARWQLTRSIRDVTLQKIATKPSVHEMWTAIKNGYESKTSLVQADLRAKFYSLRCNEKSDLRAHLDKFRAMHADLSAVGVKIDDAEYASVIMKSLPKTYASYLSTLSASAHLLNKTLDPDAMITYLLDESDRQKIFNGAPKGEQVKEKDVALSASASPGGKRKGKRGGDRKDRSASKAFDGECFNCGGKGHRAKDCPSPKRERERAEEGKASSAGDSKEKKGKGRDALKASIATEEDGVWSALVDADVADLFRPNPKPKDPSADPFPSPNDDLYAELMSDDEDIPDLVSVAGSDDDESDRLTEVDDDLSELFDFFDIEDDGTNTAAVAVTLEEVTDEDEPVEVAANAQPTRDIESVEVYDSGATRHMSPYRAMFESMREIPPRAIAAANKTKFNAIGMGDMVIDVPNGGTASKMRLTEVLYSPEIGYTLVSIGRIDDAGYSSTFGDGQCRILDHEGKVVGVIPKTNHLYCAVHESAAELANIASEKLTVMELHRRMGHIAPSVAKRLVEKGFVTGIALDLSSGEPTFCESCVHAKSKRKPVPQSREGERATEYGGEVHSDLWGPAPVESLGGKRYYVTFTDDQTRHTHLYLLREKSETFDAYRRFEAWANTHMSALIKILRSDRGGEYLSDEFISHLEEKGTRHKLTVHDTPEENGVSERLNGILIARVRAMLHDSGLPKFLWGEAVRHATWLKNRTSTKALNGQTPYEAMTGKKPNLAGLHVWGCRVWVHDTSGTKLDSRAKEGRWMGFDEQSKGHRVYWPGKRIVTVERSVTFSPAEISIHDADEPSSFEGESVGNAKRSVTTASDDKEAELERHDAPADAVTPPEPHDEPHDEPPTRPARTRKSTRYIQDILDGKGSATGLRNKPKLPVGLQVPESTDGDEAEEAGGVIELAMAAGMADVEGLEPRTLAEAQKRPDWLEWKEAIESELAQLEALHTWDLVEKPKGVNVVGSKWVFRAKKNAAGEVVKAKARLVAQGFSQVPGVDYFDTFAPVATFASSRTVLAFAASLNLELHQMDVKGAYLNGELAPDEVIYMRQPPGYEIPGKEHLVCRLRKTLYGLKQSGRRWYEKLSKVLAKLGLKRCEVDQAVFFRHGDRELVVIVIHVDDLMIAASDKEVMAKMKKGLSHELEMSDSGDIHWLLGVEIRRNRDAHTISLSQRAYIDSILADMALDDTGTRPNATPMDPHTRLSRDQAPTTAREYALIRDKPYRRAVGSLMYLAVGTRPDIAYAVQTLSRFVDNPGIAHWEAVKRTMRYLKGTRDWWLVYGGEAKDLVGYSDADGNMHEDRHAISGYAFILNGGAVSWSSKRQPIIALSTTESEYIAATHAAKEALWLRTFIGQVFRPLEAPTILYSDNQSAIALTRDHQYHARTKHIDIRFHFIRWIVENGSIKLVYCPTDEMVADTLTKALPSPKAKHFASALGLRPS
jgi:hypothetical protein